MPEGLAVVADVVIGLADGEVQRQITVARRIRRLGKDLLHRLQLRVVRRELVEVGEIGIDAEGRRRQLERPDELRPRLVEPPHRLQAYAIHGIGFDQRWLQAQRGLERIDGVMEPVRLVQDLRQHGMGVGRVGLVLQGKARGLLGLFVVHLAQLRPCDLDQSRRVPGIDLERLAKHAERFVAVVVAIQHRREVDIGLDVVPPQADGLAIGMLGLGDMALGRAAPRPCCCRPPDNSRGSEPRTDSDRWPRRNGRGRAAHCPGCYGPRHSRR